MNLRNKHDVLPSLIRRGSWLQPAAAGSSTVMLFNNTATAVQLAYAALLGLWSLCDQLNTISAVNKVASCCKRAGARSSAAGFLGVNGIMLVNNCSEQTSNNHGLHQTHSRAAAAASAAAAAAPACDKPANRQHHLTNR
jgi:hypothetical protein